MAKPDKDTPAVTASDVNFASQHDELLLGNVLNAYGYFNRTITHRVDNNTVTFDVKTGQPFKINKIDLESCDDQDAQGVCLEILPLLKIKSGDILTFENLNEEHKRLLDFLQNRGYIKPQYKKPQILLHHDKQQADIVFRIIPGRRMTFGDLYVTGLDRVKLSYIQRKITWKKGKTYDKSLIEKFRVKLYETGLFSLISFKNRPHPETGATDIEVRLTEMPPRYIGISGFFRTAEGLGGQIEWRHRNLTGRGDELGLKINMSQYFKRVEAQYSLPHFIRRNQKTYFDVMWEKSNIDAYDANLGSIYPYVKTKFGKKFKVYTGVKYETGSAKKTLATYDQDTRKLNEIIDKFDVGLVSFPVSFVWDTTDNKFAPTKGLFWKTELEPFLGKEKQNFTKIQTALSYLMPVIPSKKDEISPFSWFNKLSFGNLIGKDLNKIVPHQRFYLGGPQDMRSYGLKLVGQLDDDKHPYGGKSFGYFVSEFRVLLKGKVTLNLFHEVGVIHNDSVFQLLASKTYQGSGATICYYSPVLPIQFGLAVPWNRRKNYEGKYIDAPVQIYVGIGQIR